MSKYRLTVAIGSGAASVLALAVFAAPAGASAAPAPANAMAGSSVVVNATANPTANLTYAVGSYDTPETYASGTGGLQPDVGVQGQPPPTASGDLAAFIATESTGVWNSSLEAPLPGDANAGAGFDLTALTCFSATSCLAVGSYVTTAGIGAGLVETLVGGAWSATGVPMPAGEAVGVGVYVAGLVCGSSSSCVAWGEYAGVTGVILVDDAGAWSALPVTLPPDAAPPGHQVTTLSGGSVAGGTYTVTGTYTDASDVVEPLTITGSGSSWSAGGASGNGSIQTAAPTTPTAPAANVAAPPASVVPAGPTPTHVAAAAHRSRVAVWRHVRRAVIGMAVTPPRRVDVRGVRFRPTRQVRIGGTAWFGVPSAAVARRLVRRGAEVRRELGGRGLWALDTRSPRRTS